MTPLSFRAKEAIKTGRATVIAHGIAQQMDWDPPASLYFMLCLADYGCAKTGCLAVAD